jgi:cytochrome c oxidase subunit 3
MNPNISSIQVSAEDNERSKKFLLWLSMISMVMIFAALTSAIVVRKADGNWFSFAIPFEFTLSTIVLLLSSISIGAAVTFTKKDRQSSASLLLFITFVWGLCFAWLQFKGWEALVQNDIYFIDNRTGNISGSFFYVVTALHLLHMIGGIIAVFVSFIQSIRGKYTTKNYLGLKLSATFWHFLDGLWLYLFLFLQFQDQIL